MNYSLKSDKDNLILSANEINDIKLDLFSIDKGVSIETINGLTDDNNLDITNEDLDLVVDNIHTLTNEDLENSFDTNEGNDNND